MNWSGKVLLWEEYGLFFGSAGTAALHESPAIKICIATGAGFGLRQADDLPWREHTAAFVPAGLAHAIDGRGRGMAMFLLAPEGELGQVLARSFSGSGITELSPTLRDRVRPLLRDLAEAGLSGEAEAATYRAVIESIVAGEAGTEHGATIDSRVSQSVTWIRQGRERGISVGEIAAGVELSESRFSHLFTEHVRVPVRRYLLWLRLRDALHLLASGGSLTDTAHEAGFADSAHLTRTFRTALGITPSALVKESRIISFLA